MARGLFDDKLETLLLEDSSYIYIMSICSDGSEGVIASGAGDDALRLFVENKDNLVLFLPAFKFRSFEKYEVSFSVREELL